MSNRRRTVFSRARAWRWALLLVVPLLVSSPLVASPAEDSVRVLSYRMKGKVRLLFFWVGKDDVGGGTITLSRASRPEQKLEEKVEVLFGSNPERVPGGINRWGYGRESARWNLASGRTLEETFFEGFMKYSKEQSLDEVQANNSRLQSEFLYEGIRSTVRPAESLSEIRVFSVEQDFDYRNAQPIQCGYERRLEGGPPDRQKQLANQTEYQAPLGFLTAIQSYLQEAAAAHRSGVKWQRPSAVRYIYNSKVFQLELRKLKQLSDFELPMPADSPPRLFKDVAKADFRISQPGIRWSHDFSIWFALNGPYRAVPLRIVDKPRWWLRVELNLDPENSEKRTQAALLSPVQVSCPEGIAQ